MNKQTDNVAKKIGDEVADYWYSHMHGQIPPIFQKQNIAGYTRELINAHFQRKENRRCMYCESEIEPGSAIILCKDCTDGYQT